MALQTSGAISLSDINVELKLSATATISLNDSAVRGLFGKASGVISLSDGYGKASGIVYINTSNRTGASIFELMGSPTQPNTYIFENQATISAGTGSYALRTGVFPAGSILKIVNKGYIRGKGGNGGPYNAAGSSGGVALYIDMDCTIDNGSGFIFGGGGGGGGAQTSANGGYYRSAGGGGAGANGGAAGAGTAWYDGSASGQPEFRTGYRAPAAGTADAGGLGAYQTSQAADRSFSATVTGGTGGGPGVAGDSGSVVQVGKNFSVAQYVGDAAGAAITKNGRTLTITTGNDTNRIRGAIV